MKVVRSKEFISPIIILVSICLIVSLALAATCYAATPVIEANALASSMESRIRLLAEADSFSDITTSTPLVSSEDGKAEVSEVFEAENGAGYVMTVTTSSFGGKLTIMVGINSDGAVTGVEVTDHSDTAGIGTKDQEPDYLAQYDGLSSLTSTNVKKEKAVTADGSAFEYISGASVSGTAIHLGVYTALEQFAAIGG